MGFSLIGLLIYAEVEKKSKKPSSGFRCLIH